MLGGMVAVIRELRAMTPPVYPFVKPRPIIEGPRMRASMAASATAAPDTPPIMALSTMLTWARPPTIHPVMVVAKEISRVVMPVAFIKLPASTKNGTASSGKAWVELAIRWTLMETGTKSDVRKNRKLARPMLNATGMPRIMKTAKMHTTSSMVRPPAPRRWVAAAGRRFFGATGTGATR